MAEYAGKKGYIYTQSGPKSTNAPVHNGKWDNADQKGQDFTRTYGNTTAASRVDPSHCSLAGDPDGATGDARRSSRGGLGTFDRKRRDARFPTKGK